MKKVINITLGSIVFAVEQDAYDALASYLESVKQNLLSSDDRIEIIADIESALAEKFIAMKRSEKVAVTSSDVEKVITEMGTPAEFGAEDAAHEDEQPASKTESETKKRLYRDTDDSIIAGVASGIAHYFDIDPVVVRIVFFVSVFFNGLGVLAYGILWFVVPKAETTTQKYAARGEQVTLKEITQRVKKNIESVDVSDLKVAEGVWAGIRPTFVKMFEVLGVLLRGVLMILRYIVGLGLLLGGAISVAGLVSVYSIILLSERVLLPMDAQIAVDTLVGSALGIVAITASFVMMSIPMLVLIIAGGSLIAKRNLFTLAKSITLVVVWIVAVMLAMTASFLQAEQVMQKLGTDIFENGQYEIHVNVNDDSVYIDADMVSPQEEDVPSASPTDPVKELPEIEPVACTMDAKICSDGSAVGRTGPNCEFTPCPGG